MEIGIRDLVQCLGLDSSWQHAGRGPTSLHSLPQQASAQRSASALAIQVGARELVSAAGGRIADKRGRALAKQVEARELVSADGRLESSADRHLLAAVDHRIPHAVSHLQQHRGAAQRGAGWASAAQPSASCAPDQPPDARLAPDPDLSIQCRHQLAPPRHQASPPHEPAAPTGWRLRAPTCSGVCRMALPLPPLNMSSIAFLPF